MTTAINTTGATAIISHTIKPDHQTDYEQWLDEIWASCKYFTGYLDRHIIRPIEGKSTTFTAVIRFDTQQDLQTWWTSTQRQSLLKKIEPYLASEAKYSINSGLDFLFTEAEPVTTPTPKRWKQFVLTWSAIFPLVSIGIWLFTTVLQSLQLQPPRLLINLMLTGCVVFMMVYVVMPHYTKLVKNWLMR